MTTSIEMPDQSFSHGAFHIADESKEEETYDPFTSVEGLHKPNSTNNEEEESKTSNSFEQKSAEQALSNSSTPNQVKEKRERKGGEISLEESDLEAQEESVSYEMEEGFLGKFRYHFMKIISSIKETINFEGRAFAQTFPLVIYFCVNILFLVFFVFNRTKSTVILWVWLISSLLLFMIKVKQRLQEWYQERANRILVYPRTFPWGPHEPRGLMMPHAGIRHAAEPRDANSEVPEQRNDPGVESLSETQRLNYATLRLHLFNLRLQLFLNNLGLATAQRLNQFTANDQEFETMINHFIMLTHPPHLIMNFPAPANRGLSPADIENFPIQKYQPRTSSDGGENNNGEMSDIDQCMICLENFSEALSIRRLPCFHIFHKECIDKWLEMQANCPLCKHSLIN